MVLRIQSNSLQVGGSSLRIVGDGDKVQYWGKAQPRRSHCDDTVEMHQLPRGSSAPGCSLLVASTVAEWWLWLRVASIGVEGCRQVAQNERENEREEFDEHFVPFSLSASNHGCFWYSADMSSLNRLTARVDGRRGSWKKCSEDEGYFLTCSAEFWWPRREIEFESAELERDGMEKKVRQTLF